jgi:alkylation response protein AidB-like acyl-CoA dehydrogenase
MRDLNVRLEEAPERLRAQLRAWLAGNAPPRPAPDDLPAMTGYRQAWHERLHAAGWSGVGWPAARGGKSASAIAKYVYYEELARAGVPRLLTTPGIALVGPVLMAHGTEAQQDAYLPRILSGEDVWCLGLSEDGAGSDLAGLATTARREGDSWVINGRKTWVRWAARSSHCALLLRTESAPRHRGLTVLAAELDAPGVTIRPLPMIDGDRVHDEVSFDEVVVAADAQIGARGGGWGIAMGLMELERADQSFADHVELLELLRQVVELAGARAGDRDPWLASFRDRAVAVWTQCQLFRAVNLHTARQLDRGQPIGTGGSVIKAIWTRLYQDLAAAADAALDVELVGDNAWSRRYLDARATSIFSGTSEIQRTIIGERIAGLPRPKVPKETT